MSTTPSGQHTFNDLTPGSHKARLGDVIYDLLNGLNALQTQFAALCVKLDAADLTGMGTNNTATFATGTAVLTPEQRPGIL